MRVSTITAVGSLTVNAATGDTLVLLPDRCAGLGGAPLRTSVEDAPEGDGGMVFPPLLGPQIITLGGWVRIESAVTDAGYLAAVDALEDTIKAALEALRAAPGNLVWPGGSIPVWLHAAYDPTWENKQRFVTFGLVEETVLA